MTIRTVALLTALTGAIGMGFVVDSLFRFPLRMRAYAVEPYYPNVLWTSVAINFACLVALWVAAVLLWRLKQSGRWLSNIVFSFEILYFLGIAFLGLYLSMSGDERVQAIANAIGAAGGTGNMGLALHLITGFPVWALIAINLAYWRLSASERTT